MDRAIEIIRKRTDAFGVSEPEISRLAPTIRVGLRTSTTPAGPASRSARPPNSTSTTGSRTSSRRTRRHQRSPPASRALPPVLRRGQVRLQAAAQMLPEQVHDERPPLLPVRRDPRWIAGLAETQGGISSSCRVRSSGEQPGPTVPQGTFVVQKEPDQGQQQTDNPNSPDAAWFVLKDRPGLSARTSPTRRRARPGQPAGRHLRFHGQGRQKFRRHQAIAERGLPERPARRGGQPPGRRPVLGPFRHRARPADQVASRSSTSSTTRMGSTAAPAPRSTA